MNTNSVTFFKTNENISIPENSQLIIAVWEIINPENIGRVIRLAHNVGAKKVILINEEINFRESKIKKTAGFSFEKMEWEFISSKEFKTYLNSNFKLVVLETCDGSKNIYAVKLPKKIILLAGNESFGIPPEIIQKSELKIHIPMPGDCKSMNISHALSVASFEWYRQISNGI